MLASRNSLAHRPPPASSGALLKWVGQDPSMLRIAGEEKRETASRAVSTTEAAKGEYPEPWCSNRPRISLAGAEVRSRSNSAKMSGTEGPICSSMSANAAPSPGARRSASTTKSSVVRGITAVVPSCIETPEAKSVLR